MPRPLHLLGCLATGLALGCSQAPPPAAPPPQAPARAAKEAPHERGTYTFEVSVIEVMGPAK